MFRDQTAAAAREERSGGCRWRLRALSSDGAPRNKERVLGPLHAEEAFTELLTATVEQDTSGRPPPSKADLLGKKDFPDKVRDRDSLRASNGTP